MARDIAIIDFGSGRVTAAIGSRGAADSLKLSGFSQVEYAGFESGQWLKPEDVSRAVSTALEAASSEAGIVVKHLYIGVPAEFSACSVRETTLSFGKKHRITADDMDKLLRDGGADFGDEAQDYTVINRQPVYYTLEDERRVIDPVGNQSSRLTGLISYVLAENRFMFFVESIMQGMGIETTEFVSAPLAEAMFLLSDEKRDRSAVIIDVGYITTSVAVVRGDGILSLSSFSLGGGHIAGDLTRYLGITFTEAEALKRKVMVSLQPAEGECYEIGGKKIDMGLANKIVYARLSHIASSIEKCLTSNRFEFPGTISYHLTGGGVSYMRGARQLLGQLLGKELEPCAPPIPQLEQPDLSSSLGLLNMILDAETTVAPVKKKKGFWAKLLGI